MAHANENSIIMTPKQLENFLKFTIPAKIPVLITGAPGIGKTAIVEAAAEATGADCLPIFASMSDPTDPKGMPTVLDGKGVYVPFSDFARALTADRLTVLFLDDFGQSTPAVQAAFMQPLGARRDGNGNKISDQIVFIGATNRKQDRANVQGILEPVKSRFHSIIELVVDVDQWCQWALSKGLPIEIISFIRFRPGLLSDFQPSLDMVNQPSPRTVHHVADLFSLSLPTDLEYIAYAGAAGEGFASEFMSFVKIFRELPNPDAVLLNPDKFPLPENPATLYALTGALARKASATNFDSIITIADRLTAAGSAEFSVLLVKDAITLKKELTATKGFTSWAVKHSDFIV